MNIFPSFMLLFHTNFIRNFDGIVILKYVRTAHDIIYIKLITDNYDISSSEHITTVNVF